MQILLEGTLHYLGVETGPNHYFHQHSRMNRPHVEVCLTVQVSQINCREQFFWISFRLLSQSVSQSSLGKTDGTSSAPCRRYTTGRPLSMVVWFLIVHIATERAEQP